MQDRSLDLLRQLDHRVHLLVALLPLLSQRLKRVVHGNLAREVVVDQVLRDREAGLDRLFARPILTVGFALDLGERNDKPRGKALKKSRSDSQRSA